MSSKLIVAVAALFISVSTVPTFAQDATEQKQVEKPDPVKKELIAPAQLKALLPETVAGLKRSTAEGQKQGYGDVKFSQAIGTYSEEGKDGSATVTIMDYGAMPGIFEGVVAWLGMEIDNESDTQIARTLTVTGYKAYLDWSKENKSGTLNLAVGGRFTVEIRLDGAEIDQLQATAEAMDLKTLEALAK